MAYSNTSTYKSTGTSVGTSTTSGSSSSSQTYETAVAISSPDDSDGLYAGYGGEAVAIGEDTLTSGSLSATMIDEGAVATVDGSVTMVAASESTDGSAFAETDSYADISGAELSFSYTKEADYSEQGSTGSTAVSTSTTSATGYDLQLYDGGGDGGGAAIADDEDEASPESGGSDAGVELDGNVASLDFSVQAVGDDSLVLVDAFALAVEDTISISSIHTDIAVD